MVAAKYGKLPFKEQVAFLRQKTNVPTKTWDGLWKESHNSGFMVAGAMKEDLLADFRSAIDTAISEGKGLNWFKKQFDQIVEQRGWEFNGTKNWRAEVIYGTNVRSSYAAGREMQIDAIKKLRPYAIYKHSGSENPRHQHLAWNNLVLPVDDPFWEAHTPPNGYGCNCKKFTLSESDLERLGLEVSPSPAVNTYNWTDKKTGESHQLPVGVDPGFDYTPRTPVQLRRKIEQAVKSKPPIAERLTPRVVDSAYSTVSDVSAKSLSLALDSAAKVDVSPLRNFIQQQQIKTVIIKPSDRAGLSSGVMSDIKGYLGSAIALDAVQDAVAATSKEWSHILLVASSGQGVSRSLLESWLVQLGRQVFFRRSIRSMDEMEFAQLLARYVLSDTSLLPSERSALKAALGWLK